MSAPTQPGPPSSPLSPQDAFFYSLVYDPSVKTLLADKGEVRVGPRYQADIPEMLTEGRRGRACCSCHTALPPLLSLSFLPFLLFLSLPSILPSLLSPPPLLSLPFPSLLSRLILPLPCSLFPSLPLLSPPCVSILSPTILPP